MGAGVVIKDANGSVVLDRELTVYVKAHKADDGQLKWQMIAFSERPVFGFQGHPEASPGPHDLRPLFERFNHLMLRRLQAQLRAAEDTLRRQLVGGGR